MGILIHEAQKSPKRHILIKLSKSKERISKANYHVQGSLSDFISRNFKGQETV